MLDPDVVKRHYHDLPVTFTNTCKITSVHRNTIYSQCLLSILFFCNNCHNLSGQFHRVQDSSVLALVLAKLWCRSVKGVSLRSPTNNPIWIETHAHTHNDALQQPDSMSINQSNFIRRSNSWNWYCVSHKFTRGERRPI